MNKPSRITVTAVIRAFNDKNGKTKVSFGDMTVDATDAFAPVWSDLRPNAKNPTVYQTEHLAVVEFELTPTGRIRNIETMRTEDTAVAHSSLTLPGTELKPAVEL